MSDTLRPYDMEAEVRESGRRSIRAESGSCDRGRFSLRPGGWNVEFFYRFRPTSALLGERSELQNQEIYFASPEQLNDPMEGFKDVYWQGDRIVWTNLIKHYLLCLEHVMLMAALTGDDFNPEMFRTIIFASEIALPTSKARDIHRKICQSFFSDTDVATIPDLLVTHGYPIRREELTFYIRGLHGRAMACITEVLQAEHLPPLSAAPPLPGAAAKAQPVTNMLRALKQREAAGQDPEKDFAGRMFGVASQIFRQTELLHYSHADSARKRMRHMICFGFPEAYVRRLNDLIYSNWYTACFVAGHNHAAMWGNYGDSHKGVCLKFRAIDNVSGVPSLKLRRIVGWHAPGTSKSYAEVPHPFLKVNYVSKFVEVDFFRSIGRMTVPALQKDWYSDDDGNISPCADEIFLNEGGWRKKYWETFDSTITTKLRDWQHENEYRLVLHPVLGGFDNPIDRK